MANEYRSIIDLHCDTITECYHKSLELKNDKLNFSLDRLPEKYRWCQCMGIYIPDDLRGEDAETFFNSVAGFFSVQMKEYGSEITQVTDTSTIEEALEETQFAAILTIESGAAIAGKLENIRHVYDLGVRMMTLTWNAENEICGGSATEKGFTDFGRKAVAEMERLGMAVDVSHLSDRGFFELCEFAAKPFVASHSNSRAVCAHTRNLSDEMFAEIAKRGGVAGLNYTRGFIREDWAHGSIDDLLKHVYHFLELGGEDAIALGSDYDGTHLPDYLEGIEKVEYVAESFEKAGISGDIVDKILFRNANRYFKNLSKGNFK